MYVKGTGTNACYVEKLERVEMWDGDHQPPRQVRLCIYPGLSKWVLKYTWIFLGF